MIQIMIISNIRDEKDEKIFRIMLKICMCSGDYFSDEDDE